MYEYLKKTLKKQTSILTDNLTKMTINDQIDMDTSAEIVSIISATINLIDTLGHDPDEFDEFEEFAVTYLLTLSSFIAYTHNILYGESYAYDPCK